MSAAVVIGASRGIGHAIARQLLAEPGLDRVVATHRNDAGPLEDLEAPGLLTARLEVTDPDDIEGLVSLLEAEGIRPALIIHCAGILHEADLQPEKSLQQCEPVQLQRLFAVNSIGPLMLARALLPLVPRRQPAHFAVLSAMVGSIGDNRLGGWYGYRASKAALNQFMRTLAIECRRTHPELCVTAIHPGTTDTALSRPFQANVKPGKLYDPARSAGRILEVVRAGTAGDSGRFVNWDGKPIPW